MFLHAGLLNYANDGKRTLWDLEDNKSHGATGTRTEEKEYFSSWI